MAPSPRKISRRDIRKPDQFVTTSRKVFHYVTSHRTPFVIGLSVIVALLLILWGWDAYRQRQSRLASQEYARAVTLYRAARYGEAATHFGQVTAYGSTPYRALALLYQANSYVAIEDAAKATASLRALLSRERKDTTVRQIGLMSLAQLQERSGNCKEAGGNFAEAEKIAGPFKDEALLGKARCDLQNQDFKGALSSYRQYASSYPGSDRSTEVALKIQELEGKIGAGTAASSGK